MIIQVFSNSMIFPCMELFFVIFHDFQSLWEPCSSIESQPQIPELWNNSVNGNPDSSMGSELSSD